MRSIVTDPITGIITLEDTESESPWGDVGGVGVVENIQNMPITVHGGADDQVLGLQTIDSVQQIVPITVHGILNVEEATTVTQATATATQVGAMTLTPAAGTYMVTFSGDISNSSPGLLTTISIWVGGSQIMASTRLYEFATGAVNPNISNFCCQTVVTVNGTQAIQGYWVTTTPNTATNNYRTLTVLLVHR